MTVTAGVPTAGRFRGELRKYRRVRDGRSVLRRVSDSDALFPSAMGVGLAYGGVTKLLLTPAPPPGAEVPSLWLLSLVAVLVLALALKALLAFGPVLVGSATWTWLLASPVDRRSVLLARFGLAVAVGAVGGGLLFVVLAVLARASAPVVLAAGVPTGVLVTALAAVVQRSPAAADRVQRLLLLAVAVDVVLVAVVTLTAPRQAALSHLAVDTGMLALGVLAAAIALTWFAAHRLGRFTRAALANGVQLADAATAAAVWLDPMLLSATVVSRRTRAIGRVRSAHLRGGRTAVLLRAEWVRLRRARLEVSVWAALAVLPYAAGEVLPSALVAPVHLVGAFLATDRLAFGLRTVARSDYLRRALGGSDLELRLTHLVIPAVAALVWCVVTFPALPVPVAAVISLFGAVSVTYRMATRQSMDYSSPVLDTPYGILPVNIIRQMARGPGLLAFLVLVQFLTTS